MSQLSPPYFLEFRAARAAMTYKNIGPAKLLDMIDKDEVFFFFGDKADFLKCPYCGPLFADYPKSFLKPKTDDMIIRNELAAKLTSNGSIALDKKVFALPSIAFVAIAKREGLICVMEPNIVAWDNVGVCNAAKVECITVADFLNSL